MTYVWFIMAQVTARPESGFPGPCDATIYVECYVPFKQIESALEATRTALDEMGYELCDVSRCSRFDLDDWDFETYPSDSAARILVERVAGSGGIEFGPFCFGR